MAVSDRIDDLDRRITERLRADGRETSRALAAAVGVNEATVAARLRRLEANDLIHIVALTDFERLGYEHFAFVFVKVSARGVMEVARALSDLPDTTSVNVVSGRYDIVCGVLTTTKAELGDVVSKRMRTIAGVASLHCELAIEVLRYDSAWAALRADTTGGAPGPGIPPGRLHDLDRRIVEALQRDARSSNRVIAGGLGISEGTVRSRLRRMEQEHLVRICAVSDVMAFGLTAAAHVGVRVTGGEIESVARALAAMPEAACIVRSVGGFDFLLILVSKDRAGLHAAILDGIQAIPAVDSTETLEQTKTVKHVYTWARLLAPAA